MTSYYFTMNIETIREYCLSLPLATEDFPFDENVLVFRVMNKIFAMVDLSDIEWFVLKCEQEYAISLRDEHPEITGAYHMNKKHWNPIDMYGSLSDELIRSLIRHSYAQVVKKLPQRIKRENETILSIE